ncbi:MAG: signal peptidase I [Planctomycetota bacterium]|jgi:signal peptidase I
MVDKGTKSKDKKERSAHPWRDNIEAITMAIIMAVMLKYFIVEAYKIPTGSMQPTLMGNDETDIKDRILVDKLSYHFRDPERFEVTVFKYPLDLSKNFIKRCVGIGPEELKIQYGDLWNRPDANSEWKILRRPRPVQEEMWKSMHLGESGAAGWKAIGGAKTWKVDEDEVAARGSGILRYPPSGSVMDDYSDGYPVRIRDAIRTKRGLRLNAVSDLRLDGDLEALPGCEQVVIEIMEGNRRYNFTLPGPKAPADATLHIRAEDTVMNFNSAFKVPLDVSLDHAWKLQAGDNISFGIQNMDDLLSLEIDGEILLTLEVPPASNQANAILIHVDGEGADFEDLDLQRDVYYLDTMKNAEFQIPADHYVMFGDNTQDSSDSREWTLARYQSPPEVGPIIRGNNRGNNENPHVVHGAPDGAMMWFRDEFGEMHTWRERDARIQMPEDAQFVPRELITGRAVVVFWPLKPSFRTWRLQWIR